MPRGAAVAFIFCGGRPPVAAKLEIEEAEESEASLTRAGCKEPLSFASSMRLPPFDLVGALGMVLPAAVAVHAGSAVGGVALGCIPVAVPFSFPQVSEDTWLGNKRARAFHRGCVLAVYVQSAVAVYKFVHGDLVGGTYDAVQALMGAYATQPDGIRLFPSWIMVSGFNGVLGIFQVFQAFQGVPVHSLPFLALGPPLVSIAGAYCGWQFCSEVRAIASGYNGEGPQDTCFVRLMGGDWWPMSALSSSSRGQEAARSFSYGSSEPRVPPFGGEGRRLGES